MMNPKRLERFHPEHYDVVMPDECHHSVSDSWQRVLSYFHKARICGWTATAYRSDSKNLGSLFEDIAYQYNIKQAISDDWLCKLVAQTIPINIDLTQVKVRAGDFRAEDLGHAIEPYLEEIAQKTYDIAKDRKILVFLPLVSTSKIFTQYMNEAGFNAVHCDGNSPDRTQILTDFANNRYNVLCNSALLLEGYDCPDISAVMVLRPTKSTGLYTQCVGRGTRKHPSQENTLLLDFLWLCERHNLCHPAHLVAEDEETAEIMIQKAKKGGCFGLEELQQEAKGDVKAQREASLARYLDANKHRKGKSVDPMAWGILIDNEDVTGYETTWGWEKQECTQKQASTLQKYGFDTHKIDEGICI